MFAQQSILGPLNGVTQSFRVILAMCISQLSDLDVQVSAVYSGPGEAGQQAGKQVFATYRVSVGAPYEWPDCEVRKRSACL